MKASKFWKKALCLGLSLAMVIGNASSVNATSHEHETAAEIVQEITDAAIGSAEKVIDEQGLLEATDVTATKDAAVVADSNLASSMENLDTAVEDAQASIDALDGKVTKEDAQEINAALAEAYNEAAGAYADAVAASNAAIEDITAASEAYETARTISEDAAKLAEAELKTAQDALNTAVEAAKFANQKMTSLKDDFAKATALASQWNAEAEEALVVATENLAAAQEALNEALAAIETEDAELKAAIEEFKACYDLFLEAADAFYESIQAAIAAQEYLDSLYAEYEAAQAAYETALADYEAVCAEYAEAGYPADYESLKAETERLSAELDAANVALVEAQENLAEAEDTYNFYEERVSYYEELAAQNEILESETATEEEKEEAAYNMAAVMVEQFIVAEQIENGIWTADTQVVKVPAEGSQYGKAENPFFVVLGNNTVTRTVENSSVLIRYGYELNEETNTVEVFELAPVDTTNFIKYSDGNTYELVVEGDGESEKLYIVVDGEKILIEKEDTRYFETITLAGQFVEDNTKVPTKINVADILAVESENIPSWALSLVSGISWLDLQYNEEENYYFVFLGVELLGQEWGTEYKIALNQDAETGVYTATYNYTVDIKSETCTNPLHKDGNHSSLRLVCTAHELDEDGNCIKECIVEEHTTIGHDSDGTLCRIESHYVDGVHQDSCGHTKYNGNCVTYTCTNSRHLRHEIADNGKVYGYTKYGKDIFGTHSLESISCSYVCEISKCEYTACKKELAGSCKYDVIGTEARSVEVSCKYPETKPQAEYENAWYDVVDNKIVVDENTTINFKNAEEGKSYSYEVTVTFVEGGDADTFYARKVSRDLSTYENLATLTQKRVDAEAAYEAAQVALADAETAQAVAQEISDDYNEKFLALDEVYAVLKDAEAEKDAKELGTLVNLPRNLAEFVEIFTSGLENSDVTLEEVIEAITTLSNGINSLEDALAAANAIEVLSSFLPGLELDFGYTAEQLTTDYWMNQGWDGIKALLSGEVLANVINSDMGQALTNPGSFKYTYFHAWLDALTTKIKVVEDAIALVEASTQVIEAGVTAVTEGIEYAEVAVDAIIATAEKEILEATVDVLAMATDILGTSEEVVTKIDDIIAKAQAETEATYLALLTEQSALSKVTFERPYGTELDNALIAINTVKGLQNDLATDVQAAEASLASAKALSEELKALEEHEHDYVTETKEATCTEDGYVIYTCTICPDTYTEVLTAPGHKYETEVVEPGCTAGGHTTHTCTVCGDSYIDDATDATGHDYEVEKVEATCETDGYVKYTCKDCEYTYTEIIKATGDDYKVVEVAATCTTDGSVTTTCSKCDYKNVETIKAFDHDYKVATVAATCTEDGSVTTTCSRCDYKNVEVIEAAGHAYETVEVKATCETDGSVTNTCSICGDVTVEVIEATGHDYKVEKTEATCTAGGFTTHTCANCNDSYVSDETEALGHDYVSVVTAPTCTTDGYTTHTCKCGNTIVDTVVKATGHTWSDWTVTKEATETSCGEKVRTCTVAGCDAKEVEAIEKLPHTHVWKIVVTEPTCTTGGYTTYTCTAENCNHVEVTNRVDALGHDYVATETEATCTEDGYFTHVCSRCNDTYTTAGTTKLGHAWGEWTTTKEATEAEAGLETRTCSHCGATESQETAKLGHTYTAVVTAPTCTEEGYTTYTCECGDSYVADKVAALGHSYETVVTAPTCTEGGYTTYTCATCGNSYVADETNALGHDYVPVVTAPTCTEEGYTTYTCSRCNDSYVADETAALGHTWGEWTTTKDSTETTVGEQVRICASCGEKETREIAKKEHVHVYTTSVVTEPTCTTHGYTTHTCACGETKVDSYVVSLGHVWGEWTTTVEATEETEGTEARECERCHVTEARVVEKLQSTSVVEENTVEETVVEENEVVIEEEETPLADGAEENNEVVIEDNETPLANGTEEVEDTEVVIEEEEIPLSDGKGGVNVGLIVACVAGVGVVGTGVVVAVTQTSAAGVAAGTVTSANGVVAAIVGFFRKIFKKH